MHSTTARTARRRTLRLAAAALVAAAGLTLTACSGSGGTDPKPASAAQGADVKVEAAEAGTASKAGSLVRTQTLADGISKAKIYKVADQHYRAEIVARGEVLATLEAKDTEGGLDANDMFVVLSPDGQIHSWMGGGHHGPGTFKVAGGWTVKVKKVGELRYRAQFLNDEGEDHGTLEANQRDAGLNANGVYVVLSAGGVISAHE
ncbi:hypothetical protein [Streptomyces sp. NBRC 110028]|uniref:hypothetical protein n=1 Tax=Streptomyces sp. NBRC 110028 TaxID=1621260 RepID=UPI0006E2EC74|nr:hypothetical protein [Streptomyces sp. NBRC 110028]